LTLFNRKFLLEIGDQTGAQAIDTLRVSFNVERTVEPNPAKADITVYNPSETTISRAQQADSVVRLQAGYEDSLAVIYEGRIRRTMVQHSGPDVVLTINCGDGDSAYRTSRITQSFPPNTRISKIIRAVIKTMKQKDVKIKAALASLDRDLAASGHRANKQVTTKGVSLDGSSAFHLTNLLAQYDMQWDIQDGELVIAKRNEPSTQFPSAVVLRSDTGLVGAPKIGENNVLTATSLLQPGIRPLRQVKIEDSRSANGFYVVQKVKHSGDFEGNSWYTTFEAVAV
jgi:hypothetical protein